MVYTLRFFSSKCSLFHNSNVFGSCIIHILCTGCAKIKKNNSGPKTLPNDPLLYSSHTICNSLSSNHVFVFSMTQDTIGGGGLCMYDHSVLVTAALEKRSCTVYSYRHILRILDEFIRTKQ